MNIENKKAAIDLTDLALGIVVLGIVVTIGASIMINMGNAQITSAPTYSVKIEAVTPSDAGSNLAVTWGKSVDWCQNSTTGPTIAPGNYSYTVSPDTGIINLKNLTSTYSTAAWKCNYTVYNVSDQRFALPNQAATGLAEYGNWFKIIVIVGVAAVVLSLIFMAFGRQGSSVGQAY